MALTGCVSLITQAAGKSVTETGNSITITGIPAELSGEMIVLLYALNPTTHIARGRNSFTGNSGTVSLKTWVDESSEGANWKGSGEYLIRFGIRNRNSEMQGDWIYTDGAAFSDPPPLYNISSKNTSIPFDKFAVIPK
jgi:hypothetical protein